MTPLEELQAKKLLSIDKNTLSMTEKIDNLSKTIESLNSNSNLEAIFGKITVLKGDKGDIGPVGKDADEQKIISEVLNKIPTPKNGLDGKSADESKIIKEVLRIIKEVSHIFLRRKEDCSND